MGAEPANVLASAATILSGVAAPFAYLESSCGIVPLPKNHTVVPDNQGKLPLVLDHLLSPALRANGHILANMTGINPAALRHLMHGSFAGDPRRWTPNGDIEDFVLKALREGLAFDLEGTHVSTGEYDLIPDAQLCRLEGLLHPAILLEGPLPSRLEKLLLGCHRSHALAIGIPLDSLASAAKPTKEVANLLPFMRGTEIELPRPRFPVSIEHHRAAGIQALFRIAPDRLSQLLPLLAPVLEETLLLSNTPPEFAVSPECASFSALYSTVTSRTIVRRRNSVAMVESFSSPTDAGKFQKRLLAHQSACDACDITIGSSVRNLPLTLAWFLLMLRGYMHGPALPTDEAIIESVFAAAGTLLERHYRAMTDLLHAAQRDAILKRVKAIVRKVAEKQLITESQLARSFDDQRIGLYRPLVQLLVDESVLSVTEERKLRIGSRRLDDVLPNLLLTSLELP